MIVCGGTEPGDGAGLALARIGRLELHGVAIRPGETACLGTVGAVPVFLLPGLPVACYAAYELLAGPAVRGMGGGKAGWHYGRAELPLRRKLVSEIGVADFQRVRVVDGGIELVGAGTAFGLASAVRADGFVVVPPGARVTRPGRGSRSGSTSRQRPARRFGMSERVRDAARQEQFLDVVDRDEAERALPRAPATLAPLGAETVPLAAALGRVLADDVVAAVDVPRLRPRPTSTASPCGPRTPYGASEEAPRALAAQRRGAAPRRRAATRGAPGHGDADRHRRHAPARRRRRGDGRAHRARRDGRTRSMIARAARARRRTSAFAGTDIGAGETVLRARQPPDLARDRRARRARAGASAGRAAARASRSSRPATRSSPPGAPLRAGRVYDSNAADPRRRRRGARRRAGAARHRPRRRGRARAALARGARDCDAGPALGRHVEGRRRPVVPRRRAARATPGIVAHGVALKPGKPLCLAVTSAASRSSILPGFPTSAIFTFHEFVAPVLRALRRPAGGGAADACRRRCRCA